MEKNQFEDLVFKVIGVLIEVHKQVGPGFAENIYHKAVELELSNHGIKYESEKNIDMFYKGTKIGSHRLDLYVENELVVELKAIDSIHKKHYEQVRSYLKLMKKETGLLANFSDVVLDQRRVESDFFSKSN